MNRRARDNRPYVPTLQRIEVSRDHIKLKVAATILFFVVGAATVAFSLYASLSLEPGWTEIETDTSYVDSCADEFVLLYNLGVSGTSATNENKAVKALYAEAARDAYKLFHSSVEYEGVNNICTINAHPNEVVTVEPALYSALELLERYELRHQYLGPAYEVYNGLFNCTEDFHAAEFDPLQNQTVRDYFSAVAGYAVDPQAVRLELLGDNRVRLAVSEEYRRFAEENDTNRFLDLSWMKNAFIADYLAQRLTEQGYTKGIISSYDGFMRNLGGTDEELFSFQLFDMTDRTVHPLAVLHYSGPASIVYLKSHPVKQQDMQCYYLYENGELRSPYLDVADGLPKTAGNGLAAYGNDAGCAEILLRVLPAFVTEELQEETLVSLAKEGIDSIYCSGNVICHTAEAPELTDIYQTDAVTYTTKQVK